MSLLHYFHDPMCSWCYAFDKVLNQIESNLPNTIRLTKILGGLAPDSTEAMPEALRQTIQSNWHQIEGTVPHIQFNYDFWNNNIPVRSTYPSCRAVLAAKKQSPVFENKMIRQIQRAYYKNSKNPSLAETLINCAEQIGLDCELFKTDLTSQLIDSELKKQIQFTRFMEVSSYPSLCLEINKQVLPIQIDYNDSRIILEQILKYIHEIK